MLLAASLAVSVCATPVFAADMGPQGANNVVGTSTLNTTVYYEVTEGFTWSVPTSIDFGKDAGVNNNPTVGAKLEDGVGEAASEKNMWQGSAPRVKVTKNTIKPGKSLKIDMSSPDMSFYVSTAANNSIATLEYEVTTAEEYKDGNLTPNYSNILVNANGTKILELNAGVDTGAVALEFTLKANSAFNGLNTAEIAGNYEGRVQFTADATGDATT